MSIIPGKEEEARELDEKFSALLPTDAMYTIVWLEKEHGPKGHKINILGNVESQVQSARIFCSLLAQMLEGPDGEQVEKAINDYILPPMLQRAMLTVGVQRGDAN